MRATQPLCALLSKKPKKTSKSQAKQPIQSETTRRRTSELVRREGAGRCVSASWSLVSTLDGAVVLALRAGCQGGQGGGGAREKSVHAGRLEDQRHPGERRPSKEAPQRRYAPKRPPWARRWGPRAWVPPRLGSGAPRSSALTPTRLDRETERACGVVPARGRRPRAKLPRGSSGAHAPKESRVCARDRKDERVKCRRAQRGTRPRTRLSRGQSSQSRNHEGGASARPAEPRDASAKRYLRHCWRRARASADPRSIVKED